MIKALSSWKRASLVFIGLFALILVIIAAAATPAHAAVAWDTFESDTLGAVPAGYYSTGASTTVSNIQAYAGSKSVRIQDTSASVLSALVKKTAPSHAKLLEFQIHPVTVAFTNVFSLSTGDTTDDIVFQLGVHTDGRLKYYDGTAWNYMGAVGTVPMNAWSKIRVYASDTTSADLYVNDVFIGTAGLYHWFPTMDRVIFRSGSTAGTGDEYYIDQVSFIDPQEEDTFEDGATGSLPANYSLIASDVKVSTARAFEGGKSLRIYDNNGSASSNAVKVTSISAAKTLEFRMYPVAAPGRNIFHVSSGGNALSNIVFMVGVNSNGSVQWYNGSSWVNVGGAGTFTFNKWNQVKLVADDTTAADLYVNGSFVGTIGYRNAYTTMDRFGFMSGSTTGTGDDFYVDNVSFQKPDPPAGIIYEAEAATLSNYTVENVAEARGGQVVKVTATGTGTASFTFGGTSGYYAINVGYFEVTGPNDSTFRVKQNGVEIDYWKGQYDDLAPHVRKVKEYWPVTNGDTFVIEGTYGTDPSKIDYLQFTDAIPRSLTRGHLIDDQTGTIGEVPSSWTAVKTGGTVDRQLSPDNVPSLRLHDTSGSQLVSAERRFLEQTSGTVTLQFRFRVSAKVDGLSWELRSGATSGVKLVTSGGHIAYENSSGTPVTLLSNYAVNTWYGVRIVANIDTDTADISINGATYSVTGVSFRNAVSSLDRLFIQTTNSGTTTMLVGPIELVKGYEVYENFLTYAVGGTPSGWTVDNSGGSGDVQVMQSNVPSDILSYKLNDTNGAASVSLSTGFTAQTGKMTAEFMFMLPVKVDGMAVQLLSGSTVGVKLLTSGGDISYENSVGTPVSIWSGYKANVWYDIRIVADASTDLADIYVNKIKVANQVAFRNNTSNLNMIQAVTSSGNTGVMWFDDVQVFQGTYTSLVPAPDTAAADSPYTVGVQACDLWREGHHKGYTALQPYDNRLPLFGYAEDGNPEVADWEAKWMLEHGISLYMPCWYRPAYTKGNPIKEPAESAKLHEGFMNGNYFDQMKFAILWENNSAASGVSNATDFKTNLLNYWIEHYFKHPSYFLIDNKPVIFVYNSANLDTDVGGSAMALNDARNILIGEGFAGAIFIAENRQTTSASVQTIKNRGFDYHYSYTWTTASMSTQQTNLTTQRGHNILDPIPVLTQGWGNEPWAGPTRKTNIPLANWLSGLSWLRDTFMPGYSSGSLGRSLILLDNWNEINEGHTLMPSNLKGFGYLDAIREVFYSGSAPHTDLLPQDLHLGPYDELTPKLY
ncbi:hypothetical protein [Paenibacillus koleovorans]|uniref:hypothetical protein n=1 Tax=Paenibacillus koleovorans TaxID=121608 RepID=UPI000FD8E836|nr:hypothetical protein [Paenibacillus koleovorans]